MHEIFGSEQDYTKTALNPNSGDDALNVRFYLRSVENKLKSWGGEVEEEITNQDGTVGLVRKRVKGAGHPVFEPIEYVEIRASGEAKFTVIDAPAKRNGYIHRFPRQYAAFKRGESAATVGMPLVEWPGCNRAEADNLAQAGVYTVEQLAAVSDGNIQHIGPIHALKRRAKDYLDAAKSMAPVTQMRSELASRDQKIAALESQLEAILAASRERGEDSASDTPAHTEAADSPVPAPRKRGRPPKVAAPDA